MNNGIFGQSGESGTFARNIRPRTFADSILHTGTNAVQCTGVCSGCSEGRSRCCSLRELNRLDSRIRRGCSALFDNLDFGTARQSCEGSNCSIDISPSLALVKTVLHTGIYIGKGTRVRAGGGKDCARRCCLGLSLSCRERNIYIKARHTENRDLRGTVAGNFDAILLGYGVIGGEVVAVVGCYNNRGHIFDQQITLGSTAGGDFHICTCRDIDGIFAVYSSRLKITAGNPAYQLSAFTIVNGALKGTSGYGAAVAYGTLIDAAGDCTVTHVDYRNLKLGSISVRRTLNSTHVNNI